MARRRMLNIYRRHLEGCQHIAKGRNWTRCACPLHVDGRIQGRRYERSLKTSDWQAALRKVKEIESGEAPLLRSVAGCVEEWEKSLEIAPATKRKYLRLGRQLADWCATAKVQDLADLDVELVTQFRSSREIARGTSARELQTLRQFFAFCHARGWIGENPAKAIKAPHGKPTPVLPFSEAEMGAILEACNHLGKSAYERLRARALILVMRYTGLAIGDAIMLRRDAIQPDGYLVVHRAKTSQPIRMKVPGIVLDALRVLPHPMVKCHWSTSNALGGSQAWDRQTSRVKVRPEGARRANPERGSESNLGTPTTQQDSRAILSSATTAGSAASTSVSCTPMEPPKRSDWDTIPGRLPSYYFWNEKIGQRALLGIAERIMLRIKHLSGVPDFHSHRFRHSLAISILTAGGTIEDVARILGNTPAVAYKHYAPWCQQIEQRVDDVMERVRALEDGIPAPKTERVM